MMVSHNYFTSSIGKKQIMALTGFGLLGFTATHLAGNLFLFFGADGFNYYAHQLTSNKLIYVAEAGLAGMFFLHIALAVILRLQNMSARPVSYYVKTRTGFGETIASKTMPLTGLILLVFIILHLLNFKFGTNYRTVVDGVEMRNLYKTVIEYFANPTYVAWYVFAMCSLGLHTSHGVRSAFQSWGVNHKKYNPLIETASLTYGVIVAVGFSSMAIFCHFQN
jgi:succinate dehydrogenase / fumarate reductase, cytochrome b subunit